MFDSIGGRFLSGGPPRGIGASMAGSSLRLVLLCDVPGRKAGWPLAFCGSPEKIPNPAPSKGCSPIDFCDLCDLTDRASSMTDLLSGLAVTGIEGVLEESGVAERRARSDREDLGVRRCGCSGGVGVAPGGGIGRI